MHPALSATLSIALAAWALLASHTASAADPTVYNDPIAQGTARFDTVVAEAGAALHLQTLSFLQDGGQQFNLPDFTITATDGRPRLVDSDYNHLREAGHAGALSGWALALVPSAPVTGSGLTFTFQQPVNAFGIEIGDWGTCCFASSLYIAFDGGATRLVATARNAADNPGLAPYGQHTNFVGAIDTGGHYQQVTLYGDGVGEYLVAGGTIRYANLPLGSLAAVPELPALALWVAGLLTLVHLHRRRGPTRTPRWNGLQRLH